MNVMTIGIDILLALLTALYLGKVLFDEYVLKDVGARLRLCGDGSLEKALVPTEKRSLRHQHITAQPFS
jgi:hypothetical protein